MPEVIAALALIQFVGVIAAAAMQFLAIII